MTKGYIYLICDPINDHFKIGVTRHLDSERLKQLQTGNSDELFIHSIYESKYPFRIENLLHKKYSSKKIMNEWFELSHQDVIDFKETCNNIENQLDFITDNPFL